MPDWIEDAAKKIKAEKERRRKIAEYQSAHQSALRANIPTAMEGLIESTEKDIALFNSHFPEPLKRLNNLERIGDIAFQVVRQYEPAFYLKVTAKDCALRYVIQRPGKKDVEGLFDVSLDAGGGIRMLHGDDPTTFAEASKVLIAPALESLDAD
jgi:hypothetical protein